MNKDYARSLQSIMSLIAGDRNVDEGLREIMKGEDNVEADYRIPDCKAVAGLPADEQKAPQGCGG